MAEDGEAQTAAGSTRAARAGWTALAAAPGLACALTGGRGVSLAVGAAAALAAAAAFAPELQGRLRQATRPTPLSPVPEPVLVDGAADTPSPGVLGREAFVQRVEADVAGGAVHSGVLGVFHFADVDRLATFDSAAADRALRAFEVRLRGAVDAAFPVARLRHGGFAAWLPLADDADAGEARLQAIAYVLSQPLGEDGPPLTPTVSTAAAAYPQDGRDAAELLRCADALLAAGGAPAGLVATVSSQSTAAARDRYSLTQELRGAIGRDELRLQFQPVIDLAAGKAAGAEALLRWSSASRGAVSPADFVPLLEESGMIDEVGLWILNAACRQLGAWTAGPLAELKVAVNVSARQFRDRELPRVIARTLELHRVAPSRLEVELTETAAMEDEARTRRLLHELHDLGVSIAIDDFGSGWSSISYLKNLPFSKLKIDREFVTEVDQRSDSRAICRSMIELGHGLGMTVLAEGMERREEVETLRAMGCRLFQGYWFSRPLDAEAFATRVVEGRWPGVAQLRVVGG